MNDKFKLTVITIIMRCEFVSFKLRAVEKAVILIASRNRKKRVLIHC